MIKLRRSGIFWKWFEMSLLTELGNSSGVSSTKISLLAELAVLALIFRRQLFELLWRRVDANTILFRLSLPAKAFLSQPKFQRAFSCWKIKRNVEWRQCGKTEFTAEKQRRRENHFFWIKFSSGRHSPPLWIMAWQFAHTIAKSFRLVSEGELLSAIGFKWWTWAKSFPSSP